MKMKIAIIVVLAAFVSGVCYSESRTAPKGVTSDPVTKPAVTTKKVIKVKKPRIEVFKMAPDLWMPINANVIEESYGTKLLVRVEDGSSEYLWSLVDAPGSICLTKNQSDMWARKCDHPLASKDKEKLVYVYSTGIALIGSTIEFKIRARQSSGTIVAEKTIRYMVGGE